MLHRILAVLFLAGTAAMLTAQSNVSFEMFADTYQTTSNGIVAGDINNSGEQGLIVCCSGGTDTGTLEFRAGNGDGTFQAPVTAGSAPTGVSNLIAVDLNGDGNLDLVGIPGYGNYPGAPTNGGIEVWLGNGDGTFQAPAPYSTTDSAVSMVAGNLFGDGHPDLAVGEGDGNIDLFRNGGNGAFVLAQSINLGGGTDAFVQVAAGDLNGSLTDSGLSDIAAAIWAGPEGGGSSEPVYVVWNGGNGTFTPVELGSYANPTVATARLNGDGMKDVLVSYTCDYTSTGGPGKGIGYNACAGFDVYYGQGGNNLYRATVIADPGVYNFGQPFGVDVNGDGYGDIVVAGTTSCDCEFGLFVWEGNPDGSFQQTPQQFLANTDSIGPMTLGDFNRDGMMDFAVTQSTDENAEFFTNSTARAACGTYTISPSVTVCQPVDKTYSPSPVTVQANSYDNTTVTQMQEYVDENLVYSQPVTSFDTQLSANLGSNLFVTKGWDANGTSFADVRNITVYSGSPGPVCPAATDSASICLPSGSTTSSPVLILGNGNTGTVVPTGAQLYINGNLVVSNAGATTYVRTTQNLASGTYDLVFKAWDGDGNVYTAEKTVTVQ